jgi:hypothetical protein
MNPYQIDDVQKKQFLDVWATGLSRPKIAAMFGKSQSWVQWMTEETGAPPRRTTVRNFKRLSGVEPDRRLERRAYYRAYYSLKRAMIILEHRMRELDRIVAESVDPQTHVKLPRILSVLRLSIETTEKHIARVSAFPDRGPIVQEAADMIARCCAACEPFGGAKKAPRRRGAEALTEI